VFALDADGADIADVRIPSDAVLAFGSERHGLSAAMRERADQLVSLPMRPLVSSYNLTTSVAMALYHWQLFQRAS
jgi:TrmH family RNA methyltransferase